MYHKDNKTGFLISLHWFHGFHTLRRNTFYFLKKKIHQISHPENRCPLKWATFTTEKSSVLNLTKYGLGVIIHFLDYICSIVDKKGHPASDSHQRIWFEFSPRNSQFGQLDVEKTAAHGFLVRRGGPGSEAAEDEARFDWAADQVPILPKVTRSGLRIFVITDFCNLHILQFCYCLQSLKSICWGNL
jgi:hypothetical protein